MKLKWKIIRLMTSQDCPISTMLWLLNETKSGLSLPNGCFLTQHPRCLSLVRSTLSALVVSLSSWRLTDFGSILLSNSLNFTGNTRFLIIRPNFSSKAIEHYLWALYPELVTGRRRGGGYDINVVAALGFSSQKCAKAGPDVRPFFFIGQLNPNSEVGLWVAATPRRRKVRASPSSPVGSAAFPKV